MSSGDKKHNNKSLKKEELEKKSLTPLFFALNSAPCNNNKGELKALSINTKELDNSHLTVVLYGYETLCELRSMRKETFRRPTKEIC